MTTDAVRTSPAGAPGPSRAEAPRRRRRRLLDLDAAVATGTTPSALVKPLELSWWDWTVFLLHTATEIEHALLVQYLYAAYSLADAGFLGANVPANATSITRRWRNTIIGIAREEMGHLLTEQNVLRFVDGPVNLDREDLPFRTGLYPFAFELEPLSRVSLAKYVAAEMPAAPDPAELPADELAEILALAESATDGVPVNRVGALFDALVDVLDDPTKLTDADLRPGSVSHQAPEDWSNFFGIIARLVTDRADAVAAITDIGQEGEGSGTTTPPDRSHFARFLTIFREFPANDGVVGPDWIPTRSVPVNPTTLATPAGDAELERGRITAPTTRLWAQLFDLRYRMLLTDLGHALRLDGPHDDPQGTRTIRGTLKDWTFDEMTVGLAGVGNVLTERPCKDQPGPDDPAVAGPPFEMPATLALADTEHAVWRLHLSLLDSSAELIAAIRAAEGTHDVLDALESSDAAARPFVTAQLAAT
ncbi:MAG TPA: ferritin-like domain-containing protein [Actinomycetospora sp.]|jgi:hypothetical protein|uniref:ferritin-like domain-containing protein n=1 Tax=Actinomycetospora sp. TaxID=1872135 RepID=UPI002F3E5271